MSQRAVGGAGSGADFDLDWLLAPATPAQWLANYHERQPLVVARDDPGYYVSFFTMGDFDRLLSCGEWTWPRVRLLREGNPVSTETYTEAGPGTYSSCRIQLDKLLAGFQTGASILMDPERFCEPIAVLMRNLEANLSYKLGAGIWLAPGGATPTPFHADVTNALILQISGSKHWRIYEPPVPLPIINLGADFAGPNPVPGKLLCEVTLRAGDLLYVPRGLGHEVTPSHDEPSLHIGLAWQVPTVYQVIRDALDELMRRDLRLRQALPPGFANARGEQGAIDLATTTARAALPDLDLGAAVSQLSRSFLQSATPLLRGAFAQASSGATVTLESPIRRRPHVLSRLERQGERLCLSFHGKVLQMPVDAQPALQFVMDTTDFTVRSIPGDLDDDEKLEFVQTLLDEGFLMLLPPEQPDCAESVEPLVGRC